MMCAPREKTLSSPSPEPARPFRPLRSLPQMPHASIFRIAASSGISSGIGNSRTSNSPGPTFTAAKDVSAIFSLHDSLLPRRDPSVAARGHEPLAHRLEPVLLLRNDRLEGAQAIVAGLQAGRIASLLHLLERLQQGESRLDDRHIRRAEPLQGAIDDRAHALLHGPVLNIQARN